MSENLDYQAIADAIAANVERMKQLDAERDVLILLIREHRTRMSDPDILRCVAMAMEFERPAPPEA